MRTPTDIVTAFLSEWAKDRNSMDQSLRDYFTTQTVWENVGFTTTHGIDEAVALMQGFEDDLGIHTMSVDMLHIAATGNVVLTERVDRMISADKREVMALRLMGVFEIEGEKIVHWREYFDTAGLAPTS